MIRQDFLRKLICVIFSKDTLSKEVFIWMNIFDLLPTFNGTVEIPQCVSIMMNQNNYNKPDGMMFEVEDGDYKTTYTAYVTKMYNAYDIVVFEVREKKSWGTWKIEYIRLIGGFNTSLST